MTGALPIFLHEEAEAEFIDAIRWYEEERPGLGPRFAHAVDHVINAIAEGGVVGVAVPHAEGTGLRRHFVRSFPYQIIFERDDVLRVLAIAHLRREPGYWRTRIDRR